MNKRYGFRLHGWPIGLLILMALLPCMPARSARVVAAGQTRHAHAAGTTQTTAAGNPHASATQQWVKTARPAYFAETIAVDPTNADIAYAGSNSSRIFKTTNGGASWAEVRVSVGSYYALTVHPANPSILFAGTGYKMIKSNTGGASWFDLPDIGAANEIKAIAVDPTNLTTIYGGVPFGWGVYKTTDAGATWAHVLSDANITALAVNPADPREVYAGAETYSTSVGGVFKSGDSGANWNRVLTSIKVTAVQVNPANPSTVYAATEDAGIFKSADGGAYWTNVNTGLTHTVVRALALDPRRPNVIYIGTQQGGVFRSVDGGASWSALNAGLPANSNIEALAISADRGVVYALNDAGDIFKWDGPPPPPSGSTYAQVIDASGQPIDGAQVYINGARVTDAQGQPQATDTAGNLILSGVRAGDTLVALVPQEQRSTSRQAHQGWAYQVNITSLRVQPDGVHGFSVTNPNGAQTLIMSPASPLVLFNLVVSIEWDAEAAYTAEISRAIRLASDFLYDMTDGQMAFGQVSIFKRAEQWANADIQIATSNIVRPHAFIGGITDTDQSHVIRVGRAWDGTSGNQGPWDAPDGYRTLAHEFGHYALYLYDQYIRYTRNANGDITGERPASCTGPENRNPASASVNASVMDSQYTSSELTMRDVPGLWSSNCEQTAQWQLNGESDWETLVRKYADTIQPARWRFSTPADRQAVLVGPDQLQPRMLNLPQITIAQGGAGVAGRKLTIVRPDGAPQRDAIVALHRQNGSVVSQGLTDTRGELMIYGATVGDIIRASSFDGGLEGSVVVQDQDNLRITLMSVGGLVVQAYGQASSTIPHLRVIANPSTSADQTELLVGIAGLGPGIDPGLIVTTPSGTAGFTPVLNYNSATDTYEGHVSFTATERGTGRVQALASLGSGVIRRQSTYRLQQVLRDQSQAIFSDDGNLELRLDKGSVVDQSAYAVVMSPGALPGPLPPNLALVGDAYDVTMSGGVATLAKPAAISLRYDGALINGAQPPVGLALYRWDPNSHTWQPLAGGALDEEHKALAAPVSALGVYALLAPSGNWVQPAPHLNYIPLITR